MENSLCAYEVPKAEVIVHDLNKLRKGLAFALLKRLDRFFCEIAGQLEADPVEQRVQVLCKVEQVPVEQLRDGELCWGNSN